MPPELAGSRGCFPTPPRLPEEDVSNIWMCVSEFIVHQMAQQKGVHVAELGTFTLSRQKIDVGNNKFILIQRPVFIVSEKFAQIHGLKYTKIHVTGDIPVIPLNFMSLSLGSSFSRDIVERCVIETLQLFSRSIVVKQNVEFTFAGIGLLIIRGGKVKMKFYKEFLHSMDQSGNLAKSLANRPGTCDSVMSSRESNNLRPRTSSAILFPRIEYNGAEPKSVMETIAEEGVDADRGEPLPKCREPSEKEEVSKGNTGSSKQECSSGRRLLNRQTIVPAKVIGVSMTEDLDSLFKPKSALERLSSPPHPNALKMDTECTRTPTLPERVSSASCLGHCRAGQELCYLCMQRAQKNVPVYFHEERKREEEEQDLILRQYQCMKENQALQQAQMKSLANREQSQKIAAYNLGISEAIKEHKTEKSPEYPKSYIFLKRPLTPPAFLKQHKYLQCLNKDVEWRKNKETKMKQDIELLDRLEQAQLAEDIASQKAKRLKQKNERMLSYKGSLDTQIKLKSCLKPDLGPFVPETIYGVGDMTNEKLAERRLKAEEFYKEQVKAADDRKRMIILNALVQQRKEADMLKKLKEDTVAERSAQFEKILKLQKALEEDWAKSSEMKRQRDWEEEKIIHSGSHLLHDQCEKYRRCGQCQKRLTNVGETNIWCESRYVPGSRIMI